ncbi:hypothetical protein ACFL0W_03140 [Nanoarchaeota archaeon]
MSDKKVIVRDLKLEYEGLFDLEEIHYMMATFFRDKWYDYREMESEEYHSPDGKQVHIHYHPWKKFTDYYRAIMKMELLATNMKEVEVDIEGHSKRMLRGKIIITFQAWLASDYYHYWDGNPLMVFLRAVWERYPYKMYWSKYARMIRDDTYDMYNRLKQYLNMRAEKLEIKDKGVHHGV